MKKIDFHIHTVPTIKDETFVFDQSVLEKYINALSLDAIAITNHNLFDRQQYELICNNITIPIFPGIEIDIENGHLLLITSREDLSDFSSRCEQITSLCGAVTSSLSISQFKDIFPSVEKYILIPHYDKDPELILSKVPELVPYITCGEVNSAKKFIACKKSLDKLTPVYFSDIRIKEGMNSFSPRYTCIDVDTLSLPSIRLALTDRCKVALSADEGHQLIDILSCGLKISTGLTVLLGERSSGKTYTLDRIAENITNPKYIKQFSLLSKDEEQDEKKFEEILRNRCASISEDYLMQFKNVVDDVKNIYLDKDIASLDNYVDCLLKAAENADREDIFSKTILFNEPLFDSTNLEPLQSLIGAVNKLIENKEFSSIINRFVSRKNLIELAIELMRKYALEMEIILKKEFLNAIINDIKSELSYRTAQIKIPNIDIYNILMNKIKIQKFYKIAKSIMKEREIFTKEIHSFKVVATARPFSGAQELKNFYKKNVAFSDAFGQYNDPYNYLCVLRNKNEIPDSDYHKYFIHIRYEVRNKYGIKASGGERAEYNLLEQLSDASQYEILLLDEPESSFDNLFLKSDVNKMLKNISQNMPVVVATHNNTIGASIMPDYILYTSKTVNTAGVVNFQVFSGFPTNSNLAEVDGSEIKKHEVLLNCLEAGESAYIERRRLYEMPAD